MRALILFFHIQILNFAYIYHKECLQQIYAPYVVFIYLYIYLLKCDTYNTYVHGNVQIMFLHTHIGNMTCVYMKIQ